MAPEAQRKLSVRTNFILALVTGMLLCTLSTLEFPEFLRLTDDTSNDYLVTSVKEVAPAAAQSPASPVDTNQVVTNAAAAPERRQHVARLQSRGAAPTVDDFLHSLCTLRT